MDSILLIASLTKYNDLIEISWLALARLWNRLSWVRVRVRGEKERWCVNNSTGFWWDGKGGQTWTGGAWKMQSNVTGADEEFEYKSIFLILMKISIAI